MLCVLSLFFIQTFFLPLRFSLIRLSHMPGLSAITEHMLLNPQPDPSPSDTLTDTHTHEHTHSPSCGILAFLKLSLSSVLSWATTVPLLVLLSTLRARFKRRNERLLTDERSKLRTVGQKGNVWRNELDTRQYWACLDMYRPIRYLERNKTSQKQP